MPKLPPPAPELPARLVEGATVLATRSAILPLLPQHKVIAEIGVGLGWFSDQLLHHCAPARFIAIDNFRLHEQSEVFGQPAQARFGAQTHRQFYESRIGALAGGRLQIMAGESSEMLARLEDGSIDIAFVDGDHTYDGVTRDLAALAARMAPDGIIIIDDYVMVDQLQADAAYGVVYAAHEFMLRHEWGMQYFVLQTNMYCQIVLRRADRMALIRQETQRLREENSALREAVALLRQSTSWRLTAPLRGVRRVFGQ